MVMALPVGLGRAVGNLIDNAIRYGGAAWVRLSRDIGEAIITVEDDGPGIPPGRLAEVFEPFVRGEDSRSAETGGAGLGLSIAHSIVAAHGGAIVLENRAGRGLRAIVRLPVANKG
jgi:signal transduction histidine kinase